MTPPGRALPRLALTALAVCAPLSLAAGDVDSMTLAGGRVTLDLVPGLALAVSQEQLLDRSSPPPCDPGFDYCLYLPEDAYAGTNLRSAGLGITRREELRAATPCLLAQPDGWSDLQPGTTWADGLSGLDGRPLATARFGDVGEGAAGSYTLGEVLRLFDGRDCWEIEPRLALTRFENYPPGQVREFTEADRNDVEQLFWEVLRSATVLTHRVTWPEEGSGDLSDFVRVVLPAEVTSPLRLDGEARGTWFHEGSFPARLFAADGTQIAVGLLTVQDPEWMTEGFVPFAGEITFTVDSPTPAVLYLERDNPTGLPEHDAGARYQVLLRP